MFSHVALNEEEVLDILDYFDLLKLLLLASLIVLNQPFPLCFGLRLLVKEANSIDFSYVIVPNLLNGFVLLKMIAEVENALQSSDKLLVVRDSGDQMELFYDLQHAIYGQRIEY